MGVDSTITVRYQELVKPLTLIDWFCAFGWNIGDPICYVPVGSDDIKWTDFALWDKVKQELEEKEERDETVILQLKWKGSGSGGFFFFPPREPELHMECGLDRRTLADASRYTDYSWYLSRILPVLINKDLTIVQVTCQDIDL